MREAAAIVQEYARENYDLLKNGRFGTFSGRAGRSMVNGDDERIDSVPSPRGRSICLFARAAPRGEGTGLRSRNCCPLLTLTH